MFPRKVFVRPAEIAAASVVQFVDVRYSLENLLYGPDSFRKGRLPGALFADIDKDLTECPLVGPGRHVLPKVSFFYKWIQSHGIDGKKPIVCYDDMCGGMGACRLWWMLSDLGYEAYVLDGGIQAFVAAGFKLDTDAPPFPSALENSLPPPSSEQFPGALKVDEIPPTTQLVDARFAIRFNSTCRPYALDKLPGHIPGGLNRPWIANCENNDPTKFLKPAAQLREEFVKLLGHSETERTIFHCASGVTGCHNIAAAVHAGLGRPKLYDGSWSEFCGIYKVPLTRLVLQQYGQIFEMQKQTFATGTEKVLPAGAVAPIAEVTVDGKPLQLSDKQVMASLPHLHLGEEAIVTYVDGRRAQIIVSATKQNAVKAKL